MNKTKIYLKSELCPILKLGLTDPKPVVAVTHQQDVTVGQQLLLTVRLKCVCLARIRFLRRLRSDLTRSLLYLKTS